MSRGIATLHIPRIILLSAHALLCHQIRPGALDARRHGRFMVVDHDLILGCSLNHLAVMADAILRLRQFLTIKEMADIACLDGTDTQFLIPGEGLVHLLLQHLRIAPCLSMTDEAHAL